MQLQVENQLQLHEEVQFEVEKERFIKPDRMEENQAQFDRKALEKKMDVVVNDLKEEEKMQEMEELIKALIVKQCKLDHEELQDAYKVIGMKMLDIIVRQFLQMFDIVLRQFFQMFDIVLRQFSLMLDIVLRFFHNTLYVYNREGVNYGSPNFDGEGDSDSESDALDHSHSSGRIFSSKKELKRELSLLALKQHFEFRIRRSYKGRFQATCKDDNFSFKVHARKTDEGKYWQIQKFDKKNSCIIEGFKGRFQQANSSVIGELVSLKLQVNGTVLKPKNIMTKMQLHYGLHFQNRKAWPVIAIDDTYLKGRFHGILFVAVCSFGNEQVYPLAFGIGHKENKKSWTWFLRCVRKFINCLTDCMFISDQHKGIKKTMRIVYPDAPHDLCVFHMTMNIKNTFKREDVTGIFKRAYKINRESKFNEEMNELMRVHSKAYDDLMTIGPTRWSPAYSHKWFHDRWAFTDSLRTQLTPWAIKYLTERDEESTSYTVHPIDWTEFEVLDGAKDGLVNLLDKTCMC
ncbi:hypothetical protein Dsin_032023 [Dipteronia sinensis]|uniref:MULE transposase domain-containing protein n=1 Tax=Dipteronia sinensis TaxID=43782 RepID=A0AAD9ZMI8_9ROSI|nr:hypothetical protein Dsin_032023 [Dipteronia sinensis]